MQPIHFLAWNIDQANREEAFPQTKWEARKDDVELLLTEQMKRGNADIVALLELCDLPDSEGATAWLGRCFSDYDNVHRRYCHLSKSFSMALLVNPKKWFVGDVRVHNFYRTPDNYRIIMFVDLQCRESLKWVTVGVTHFDLDEPRKRIAAELVCGLLRLQVHPTFVYGDYNFFDDADLRQEMLDDGLEDLAYPLVYGETKQRLYGTFFGFPHDEFRQKPLDPASRASRLDHIFARAGVFSRDEDCAISPSLSAYMLNNDDYRTYSYPSDHVAIGVSLTLRED